MKNSRPKSNTLIALPIILGLFVCAALAAGSGMTEANKTRVFLVVLSSLFWAPGAAICVTGYRWKNLAPGNRGPHKSENPRAYRNALIGYSAAAFAILFFALLK